ncbi:MAG TPA: glucokinase [Allosphingosinicella sp.]|nr:glucokinase [Allosphingosinicella sp.]
MTELVAADIGGTHARFAIAEVEGGRVLSLGEPFTVRTADHPGLEQAWAAFAAHLGQPPPAAAALAIAGSVRDDVLGFTNSPWTLPVARLHHALGLDFYRLINDFGALSHAVAHAGAACFRHICGPDRPLPNDGAITIVGPGTGLGVGLLLRAAGHYHVVETEGGHADFAPVDAVDDLILAHLRDRFGRVSTERILSGPGLAAIAAALAAAEGASFDKGEVREVWDLALAGEDRFAALALERFCLSLGAVAGDLALAQGAAGVVIAGGLGLRLAEHLPASGFAARFAAKGRFEPRMRNIPVKLITHPQPGLLGAAAAYARGDEDGA